MDVQFHVRYSDLLTNSMLLKWEGSYVGSKSQTASHIITGSQIKSMLCEKGHGVPAEKGGLVRAPSGLLGIWEPVAITGAGVNSNTAITPAI